MTFGSLLFLFIFFPLTLLLYNLVSEKDRLVLLSVMSILFYAWGSPSQLLVLALSMAFNYTAGIEIDRYLDKGRPGVARIALFAAVLADVAVLAAFKYTTLTMPIGISFYTFSVISYLADIYKEEAPAETSIVNYILYVSFFPKITSGPIVRYVDFKIQLEERASGKSGAGKSALGEGMNLFLIGLFKKVLIADTLGAAFGDVTGLSRMAAGTAWLGMIFYSLQLYFDFSGYSDMAIGLARIFGFRFDKNFDYPYLSTSISEFWRRWHISLGSWFKNYVYIPLGGNRCTPLRQAGNLMAVWILTGIWHGSTWNYLVWGLYHGFFVLLEKFALKNILERIPVGVRVALTDLIAMLGWVFFFSPSLSSAFQYFGKMFGSDGYGFWDQTTSFFLKERILLLIVSVLLCGPFVKNFHDTYIYRKGGAAKTISVVLYAALFLVCIAGLVSATYTSFLYVQF